MAPHKTVRNNSALYGVFFVQGTIVPVPCFGLMTNRRKALQAAKMRQGYVMVIPRGMDRSIWGSIRAWDAPTFRHTADLVADFRKDSLTTHAIYR